MNRSRQRKLGLGMVMLLVAVSWSGLAVLALLPAGELRPVCALLTAGGVLCAATPVWLLTQQREQALAQAEEGLSRLAQGNLTGAAQLGSHPAAQAARLGLRALRDSHRLLDDLTAGRLTARPRPEDYTGDYAALGEGIDRLAWAYRSTLRRLAEPVEELSTAAAREQIELRALARAAAALQADAHRLALLLERSEATTLPRTQEAQRLAAALTGQTVALRRLSESARQQTEQSRRLSARLSALSPPVTAPPAPETGGIALPGGGMLHYSRGEEPPAS